MPQNVLVSVLGEGKYLTALVRAILEKNIIPTRFLFLSAKIRRPFRPQRAMT